METNLQSRLRSENLVIVHIIYMSIILITYSHSLCRWNIPGGGATSWPLGGRWSMQSSWSTLLERRRMQDLTRSTFECFAWGEPGVNGRAGGWRATLTCVPCEIWPAPPAPVRSKARAMLCTLPVPAIGRPAELRTLERVIEACVTVVAGRVQTEVLAVRPGGCGGSCCWCRGGSGCCDKPVRYTSEEGVRKWSLSTAPRPPDISVTDGRLSCCGGSPRPLWSTPPIDVTSAVISCNCRIFSSRRWILPLNSRWSCSCIQYNVLDDYIHLKQNKWLPSTNIR